MLMSHHDGDQVVVAASLHLWPESQKVIGLEVLQLAFIPQLETMQCAGLLLDISAVHHNTVLLFCVCLTTLHNSFFPDSMSQ